MSVKRYNLLAVEYYDGAICEEIESECGDWVLASDYDELRNAVSAMIAALSKGVFDPGEYFDYDVRVMCAKEFSAARKSVEELL